MNTPNNQTHDAISVQSFSDMQELSAAYPFVGGLSRADVAVVPMNPPRVAEKLRRAESADQAAAPRRGPRA